MANTVAEISGGGAAEVPSFPMPRADGCPFDPPPELRRLQDQAPLSRVRLWDGSTPWLVTRFNDLRDLLADPRVSADSRRAGFPHISESIRDTRDKTRTFLTMDGEEHSRIRRMVTGSFTARRMEAMRPTIQKITDRLIDDMLAGPCPTDLVQTLALALPSIAISELLGVPYADHDFFQSNTAALTERGLAPEKMLEAQRRMVEYLEQLVGDKLLHPGDDMLSRLASEQVATGAITRQELASMGFLLLIAGHETTANMITLGTLALLEHPYQLAELRATEGPKLVAGAVEELLRYLHIVHSGRRRIALEDIDIAGQTIGAGEGIVLANDIGNRDPEFFPEPDRLDIHRDARRHQAFGFGPHQCLGQPLARLELQVVYGTLYRRIPTLRLAIGLDEVQFKRDGLIYGVYELPVEW
ncbi:cytochrome P450 [Streptomyces doebereineriae]|uniref:Cytochrome P450 n=1 Tax=Streptomyces doebereineriae TaxID=3075528 RepID=A0ABU2VK16_9ACTN|nr:cytochrome P450 [Streptomyces sp. DSM 41640]MDT0485930.1 cytochrome P450 [Streptomyces sp. DSM 41640]